MKSNQPEVKLVQSTFQKELISVHQYSEMAKVHTSFTQVEVQIFMFK